MARQLGMDPASVTALSSAVESQLGMLDQAQGSLTQAMVVSNNPLSWALEPGSLIVAPWSVSQLATANAEIAFARASARELIGKLMNEIDAQRWVSGAHDASYITGYAWRTADANRVPTVSPWEFLVGVPSTLKFAAETVADAVGAAEDAYNTLAHYGAPVVKDLKNWWDTLPPWARVLTKVGRALPWVGTGISVADFASEYANDPRDVWQLARHGVSVGLDLASIGTGVVTPPGLILAGAGIVWDLSWELGDQVTGMVENPERVAAYYEESPWMLAVHALAPITFIVGGPFGE